MKTNMKKTLTTYMKVKNWACTNE